MSIVAEKRSFAENHILSKSENRFHDLARSVPEFAYFSARVDKFIDKEYHFQ